MDFLKNSLRRRLTFIITCMVLIIFVVNAWISTKSAKKNFENLADEKYCESAKYYAETVDNWFNGNVMILKTVAELADDKRENIVALKRSFVNIADCYDAIDEIYYCGDDNYMIFAYYTAPEGFVGTERVWYTGAKNTTGIYYSEPYVDEITGENCITISMAVADGVVGMDLDIDTLIDELPELEKEYILIATEDNNIVVHPNPEFAMSADRVSNLSDVLSGAYLDSIQTDALFTDYNGVDSYITSETVEVNGWTVAVVTPKSVYDAPVQKMINLLIILAIIFLLVAIAVVISVSIGITRPLLLMSDKVNGIVNDIQEGRGDLTARINYSSKDELGKISAGINRLMEELEKIIPKSKDAANQAFSHSYELVGITEQLTTAVDGISNAVEDIANGATSQAMDVQSATENVEQIGQAIDHVANRADKLKEISNQMQTASIETEKQVGTLQESTTSMGNGIEKITEHIRNTGMAVDRISEKVSTIGDIADQTNLLSLNATIEAARAGEMGKGFAVVAEEIGKLAINSAQAAQDIKEEMDELLRSSQSTVEESERVHDLTISQQKELDETKNKIHSLLAQIDNTIKNINAIEEDAKQCVSSKVVIIETMDSLSAISEENAASSEETSATTIEINQMIKNLSNCAQNLNELSVELNDSLSIFA